MSETEQKPIPWLNSTDMFETYSNMTHVMWSLDDVRLRFGQIVQSPDTPNPGKDMRAVVGERCAVTLGWRGAKILRDSLSTVIDAYERANGEISVNVKLPQVAE